VTSLEAIRDAITQRHHPPIPAPSRVESHQAKQLLLKTSIIARLSTLILSKTYPTKVTSRHVGFWLVGLFCQKATRIMDPYFQYFSSNSSEMIITMMRNSYNQELYNTINSRRRFHIIIKGYHGQLIKQSRITVRGRQSIDS
jgi:hypothetical protein